MDIYAIQENLSHSFYSTDDLMNMYGSVFKLDTFFIIINRELATVS